MAKRGGSVVAHKAFSETKEEFESQETLEVESDKQKRLSRKQLRWLTPLVIGTGLGIVVAIGGTRLLSRPPVQTPNPVQPHQSQPAVMSVTVAPVQSTSVVRMLNVTGTVAARDLLPVLPQTTGLQIRQILAEEGNVVKKGQVMAVLDNSVLKAQLDEAKADMESAQAVVWQKQAALAQARATVAEAQATLQRYQNLGNQGAISRQELDTRTTTATTAQENVRVAQADISSAQADVRSNRARVQQLQTQLEQTLIRAPASGLVAEEIAEVGDITNGMQKLFSIIQDGLLELSAEVPAIQLPQVRINAPAQITSDADPRIHLQGKVREIAELVNVQSRQAEVRINLQETTLLRPGMFVRAAIMTTSASGITVPAKAVLPQPDGSAIVFLLAAEDKVKAQTVEVGEVQGSSSMEIKNGLKQGDHVVVAGAGYLKDGDRVQVIASQKSKVKNKNPMLRSME